MEKILEATNPTLYMNTQPWEVFVVTGEKKIDWPQDFLTSASSGAVQRPNLAFPKEWPELIDRRSKHSSETFRSLGDKSEGAKKNASKFSKNFQFYKAPCISFSLEWTNPLHHGRFLTLASFTSCVLMAAWAEGLVCCVQALSMAYPDIIREEFGISANTCLILAICIGYPDMKAQINQYNTTRKGLTDFIKWYGFSKKSD